MLFLDTRARTPICATPPPGSPRRCRRHAFALACAVLAGLGVLFSPPAGRASVPPPSAPLGYPDIFALRAEHLDRYTVRRHVVKPGETLGTVLDAVGLGLSCVAGAEKSCPDFRRLSRLKPGDVLTVQVERASGEPVKLTHAGVDASQTVFHKRGDAWSARKDESEPITLTQTVSGVVTDTLYESCVRAGLPARLIMALADLFAHDVDFNTDIQAGDTFAVHYETHVKNGKRVGAGHILAASIRVAGDRYEAFRYQPPGGKADYYDARGNSQRKLFLRAPLSYSRISSHFTYKRLHPVLRIYRPHLGIDYAAPTGTPISALGDGTIAFLGAKGGFGRYIEVRHNATYTTTYGHLSRYARGLHAGSHVEQGQVIGYVGQSGLATGPHLDFRFLQGGKPVNFLKTAFPNHQSLPKHQIADFTRTRNTYAAALQGNRLAEGQKPPIVQ